MVRTGRHRPLGRAARRHEEAGARAPASSIRGDRPGSVALGGLSRGLRGVAAPQHARPSRRPARPSRYPSRPASRGSLPLPGFAAAHASGVTVVQSIVASVASFMWATQETNAPWLRNPSGVGICAAADTSAPWLSADVQSVSAPVGVRVLGRVSALRLGRLGLRRLVSGASVSGASLSSSSVPEVGVSALGTRSAAGWPSGAAANTTPADIASTTTATPRPRKRRIRSDNAGTSGRVLPVTNDNGRHRRGR